MSHVIERAETMLAEYHLRAYPIERYSELPEWRVSLDVYKALEAHARRVSPGWMRLAGALELLLGYPLTIDLTLPPNAIILGTTHKPADTPK